MSSEKICEAFVVRVEGSETLVVITGEGQDEHDVLAILDTQELNSVGVVERGDIFKLKVTFASSSETEASYSDFELLPVDEGEHQRIARVRNALDQVLREEEKSLPKLKRL